MIFARTMPGHPSWRSIYMVIYMFFKTMLGLPRASVPGKSLGLLSLGLACTGGFPFFLFMGVCSKRFDSCLLGHRGAHSHNMMSNELIAGQVGDHESAYRRRDTAIPAPWKGIQHVFALIERSYITYLHVCIDICVTCLFVLVPRHGIALPPLHLKKPKKTTTTTGPKKQSERKLMSCQGDDDNQA